MKNPSSSLKKPSRSVRKSRGKLAFELAAIASLTLGVAASHAVTFTYFITGNTGDTTDWSTGTHWSAVPVSGSDTTLSFGGNANHGGGWGNITVTSRDDLQDASTPFQLNVLTLAATNTDNNDTVNYNIQPLASATNTLAFVPNGGNAPTVNLNSSPKTGAFINYNVKLNASLTGPLTFQGAGSSVYIFSGILSDGVSAGSIVKTGASAITLSGSNAFTGSVQVEGGTLTLSGSNAYTGTSTVSGGTLAVKFNSSTATNTINSASGLVLGGVKGGGTLTATGNSTANSVNSQTFNGLTLNSGASTLNIANGVASGKTLVALGAITRNGGSTVNFVQPTVNTAIGAQNGYTTSTSNDASEILGAYATVGGTDWATNDGTYIVAYTGYTTLSGATPNIVDGAVTNVQVDNTSTLDIGQAAGTVNVNTLLVKDAAARTITIGDGNTLRFGAVGGILTPVSTGTLTIGASGNAGTVTAGGTDNTAGELIINNATVVAVNSAITDNGTGAVALTKSGTGTLTLNTASTNSGGTTVNAGTLGFVGTGGVNRLSTTGDITVTGGTLNFGTNGSQTTSGAVILAGGTITTGTLTKNVGNFDLRNGGISTKLAGTSGLLKTTSGVVTFTNTVANTFTGTTTITEGGLVANIVGYGTYIYAIPGDLVVGSPVGGKAASYADIYGSNQGFGGTNLTVYSNGSVNFGTAKQPFTSLNTITIIGGSVATGNNTTLNNPTINITGGALTGSIGSGGGDTTFNIKSSASSATISLTGMANSYTFAVADGAAATDLAFTGQMTGASKTLTKTGAGLMALSGTNTYTGATTITNGTLAIGATGSIAGTTKIDVQTGGSLDLSALSGFIVGASQTLQSTGAGTVTGPSAGALIVNGTLSPGGTAIGSLAVSGSLTLAGTTVVDLNKTGIILSSDLVSGATTLTLGGTVVFNLTGDPLANGDVFTVFGASSYAGSFATYNLPMLNEGLAWDTTQLSANGDLLVVAVPEPTTWAMVVGGLGMLIGLRRMSRRSRQN